MSELTARDRRTSGLDRAVPGTALIHPERISILGLLSLLFRHLKTFILVPVATVITAVALTLLIGRNYVAESTIIPQLSDGGASRLSGLAAQFGFALPNAGQGESAPFYARVLNSRELLSEAVESEYHFDFTRWGRDHSIGGNLIEIFGVRDGSRDEQLKSATKRLAKNVQVSVDRETSIITVSTRTKWPALSIQLNQRLLELLNEYNLERRQTIAAAERKFIEGRLEEARRELLEAEEELEGFLEHNRSINSPQLTFERSRLQRNVDLRHQVYTTLAQAYEQARIEEVRNTPIISILESPERSTKPAPRLLLILLISGVLGLVIATGVVAIGEYLRWQQEVAPDEYRRFVNSIGLRPRI